MATFLPPIISIFQFILSVLCMHTMNRVPLHTPSPSFTPSCTPSPSSSSQSVLLLLPLIPTAPVRSLWFQWPIRSRKAAPLHPLAFAIFAVLQCSLSPGVGVIDTLLRTEDRTLTYSQKCDQFLHHCFNLTLCKRKCLSSRWREVLA